MSNIHSFGSQQANLDTLAASSTAKQLTKLIATHGPAVINQLPPNLIHELALHQKTLEQLGVTLPKTEKVKKPAAKKPSNEVIAAKLYGQIKIEVMDQMMKAFAAANSLPINFDEQPPAPDDPKFEETVIANILSAAHMLKGLRANSIVVMMHILKNYFAARSQFMSRHSAAAWPNHWETMRLRIMLVGDETFKASYLDTLRPVYALYCQYPRLRFTSITTNKLRKYIVHLRPQFEQDAEFWTTFADKSPQQQVATQMSVTHQVIHVDAEHPFHDKPAKKAVAAAIAEHDDFVPEEAAIAEEMRDLELEEERLNRYGRSLKYDTDVDIEEAEDVVLG